jgi:hypothetical protein
MLYWLTAAAANQYSIAFLLCVCMAFDTTVYAKAGKIGCPQQKEQPIKNPVYTINQYTEPEALEGA